MKINRLGKILIGIGSIAAGIFVAVKVKDTIDYNKCQTPEDFDNWNNRNKRRFRKVAEKVDAGARWCKQNEESVQGMTRAVEFGTAVFMAAASIKKVYDGSKAAKKIDDISEFCKNLTVDHEAEFEKGYNEGIHFVCEKLNKAAKFKEKIHLKDNIARKTWRFRIHPVYETA